MNKIKSNGDSSSYYVIPEQCKTIGDLIDYKQMSLTIAYIFSLTYILHMEDDVKKSILNLIKYSKILKDNGLDIKYGIFKLCIDIELPSHAKELRHLMSFASMSKSRGDIFKSCYRLGEKDGIDTEYDINKIYFFAQDLLEMCERNEHI